MELSKLVPVFLQAGMVLMVVGLGLNSTPRDVTSFWQRRTLMLRSILALNLLTPLAVVGLVALFEPIRPVKAALILLALSPVPPFLPLKQFKLGGRAPYIYGLLVTASLISIVFVPLAVKFLGQAYGANVFISPGRVAQIVLMTVLLPLGVGMLIRKLSPVRAAHLQPIVSKASLLLLIIPLAFILGASWRLVMSLIGNGTILVIALVMAVSIAIGHVLGGPDDEDRVVLALACAAHHPAIAIAVASVSAPGQREFPAAVLLYMLLNFVVTVPYTMWRKRASRRTAPLREHVRPA